MTLNVDSNIDDPRDPWSFTLAALRRFSSPGASTQDISIPSSHELAQAAPSNPGTRRGLRTHHARAVKVTVLEQLPESLVALAWHDPTLCNYEEQIWSPMQARRAGRCALSGLRISRGDAVYTPRTRGKPAPLNEDAMILASALRNAHEATQP